MKLEGIREKVFLDRYSLKDKEGKPLEKKPEEMWKRVAHGISKVEQPKLRKFWENKFYNAMEDFKFVPGGRVLAGAGTGYAVTFYNCFVIPSPQDSRGGILETLKQMVEIMAHGGGVGINLSSLRPRGFRVKKVNGFSSGPCNWAELFSVATKDIIQQGGSRRGALMLMLWDWHPDIEEFITVKQDLTRINGANLSVCASDEFMEAVKKNKDWDLVFPDKDDPEYDEKWDGILANWKKMGKKVKVYKTVKARYLWDLISQAAWRSAEPGLVFMERYNKWYNNWYWNTINCVNPCVTGDTLVTVEGGYKKAKDLKVGDKILTPKGLKPVKKFYNNGKKRIYKVTFSDGGTLSATADHKLKVVRKGVYEWVKVTELKKEDNVVKLLFLRTALDERGQSNEDQNKQQQQHYYHHEVLGIKGSNINHNFAFLAKTKLTSQETMVISNQNNTAPQSVLSIPASTGGSTANAKTTCPTSAEMSASFLNSDRVNTNLLKNEDLRFPGMDTSIANLHLAIAQVESVKDTGIYEEVFDVYEPETLTWITNDYVSLDCGEEGLPAWGVCNLASLNLSAFVKGYSVDKPGTFDYESLAEHARIAVRFQDDVVDADNYVYSEIKEMQLNGERRIGLGTLGLADALIKMHLRYGSDKATKVVDKIYKTIRDAAYDESVNIAKEKGAFPKINVKKHLKGYFIKQLPESVIKKMKKYGVRNSMLLQAAPTGTTSLLSGASSGVEPVYEFEYTHNGRLGKQVVYHSLYGDWKKKYLDKPRPDYFAAANDLTPEDHVKIQATVQKYVDASISKTVNAPNAHTVDDVKKLYMMAYDMGCKGITYMRDGSRMGVLQRVEDAKKEDLPAGQAGKIAVSEPAIVRRPMMVEGVTYQTKTPVGEAFITINHDEKKEPFEVFITIGKSGSDIAAMAEALGRTISLSLRLTSGLSARERIRQVIAQLAGIGGAGSVGFGKDRVRSLPDAVAKVLARHYNFAVNGKVEDRKPAVVVEEGQKETNGHTNGSAIKNGEIHEQVNVVVMQQLAINGSETDLSSATSLFDICPDCGSGTLAYEEGCKKCYSCGYSAC